MTLTGILDSDESARVAHVGASLNKDNPEHEVWSDSDEWHIREVWEWLDKYGFGDMMVDRDDDYIDLHDNRDFLRENRKYDIVILHMVYNPLRHDWDRYTDHHSPFRISPLHDRHNWVSRLVDTEAHYIFTFGSGGEVDGSFLKKIPGYDGPIDAGNFMEVYMRLW